MQLATLITAGLSLVCSAATLTVVLVGGKRVKDEMDTTKDKAERGFAALKQAIMGIEF